MKKQATVWGEKLQTTYPVNNMYQKCTKKSPNSILTQTNELKNSQKTRIGTSPRINKDVKQVHEKMFNIIIYMWNEN